MGSFCCVRGGVFVSAWWVVIITAMTGCATAPPAASGNTDAVATQVAQAVQATVQAKADGTSVAGSPAQPTGVLPASPAARRWRVLAGESASASGPTPVLLSSPLPQLRPASENAVYTANNLIANVARATPALSLDGVAPGQFSIPLGVAIDKSGDVYVADAGNSRVQKLTPTGSVSAVWPIPSPSGARYTSWPTGIAVDSQGSVYVVDWQNDAVSVLDRDGRVLSVWTDFKLPSGNVYGTDVAFDHPTGVAIGASTVYVADAGSHRVMRINANDGTFAGMEVDDPGGDRWDWPVGVAVNATGSIFLTRVWPRSFLSSTGGLEDHVERVVNGRTVDRWGATGGGRGQFFYPGGIAVDYAGNVWIADTGNDRIQELSPIGEPLAAWGNSGDTVGQFHYPTGIAVDSGGRVYVADSGNQRVQVLEP